MINLFWLGGVVVLAMAGVLGDYFIKLSGESKSTIFSYHFFIGFCIYASTAFGWFYVMKHVKLGTLGVFYSISTVLLLALVGTIFFKESLSSVEIIGIILAIVALILLARFG